MRETIIVKDLQKSFKKLKVLDGISFSVEKGKILALLGPNGAGKTTTIRILSTLLLPDGGEMKINGCDVVNEPDCVQASIGLTGQFAAVDEYLTGEENLAMMGGLYRLDFETIRKRTGELLLKFDLLDAAKRRVKTYSGGMRRKLDLAMSLIASPPIIFLDEPTTGLDPRSRLTMWKIINDLAKAGTTILLTTQYMDEAERLADNVVILDNGKIIAEGTPDELKKRIGSETIEIAVGDKKDFERAKNLLQKEFLHSDSDRQILSILAEKGAHELKETLQLLENEGIKVETVSLRRPTLDDVFLQLTGHVAEEKSNNNQK